MKINFKSGLLILSTIISLVAPAYCQNKVIHHDNQIWGQGYLNTYFTKNIFLESDAGYRGSDWVNNTNTLLIRSGIGIKRGISTFSAGYGYFNYNPNTSSAIHENRIYQKISIRQEISKKVVINHTYRLEERFQEKVKNHTTTLQWRMRYQFGINYMLTKLTFGKITPYLEAREEVFLIAGKNVYFNYFSENRLFLGVGFKLPKGSAIIIEYMNDFKENTTLYSFNDNHVIYFAFKKDLRLRKKEEEVK